MAWAPYRWDHYEIELVDSSLVTIGHLNDAHMLAYDWGTFGYGKATLALHKDSIEAATLLSDEQFYIKVFRNGVQIRDFMISKHDHGYERDTFDVDEYVKIFLGPLDMFLAQDFCQPENALGTFETPSLPIDDGFKWIVDHVMGPNAYNSFAAANRTRTGLTIAADLSDHPTTQVIDACHKMNLFEFLQKFGPNYDVDWRLRLEITTGNQNQMVFETFYPRRGLDKSESEYAARAPVIVNDASVNVPAARRYRESGGMVNVWVSSDESGETADAASVAAWGRRAALASTSESDKLDTLIINKGVITGQEYVFNPSEQMQLGDDFSPGDVVTVGNAHLGIAASDQNVRGALIEISEGGEEDQTLTFGEYEKTLGDKIDDGGGGGDGDEYWDPVMGLRDNAALFVPFSADLLQQHVNLKHDGTLSIVGTVATNTITFGVVAGSGSNWTVAAGAIYTTVANLDVVPNSGSGTIGQVNDFWDAGYFDIVYIGSTVLNVFVSTTYLGLKGTSGVKLFTGANLVAFNNATSWSPGGQRTINLGSTAAIWKTAYIDDIDLDGSITMDPSETVDGVDVSAHDHGGNTGNAAPALTGLTTSWDVAAFTPVYAGANKVRDYSGGTIFFRTFANAADAGNDVNATGEEVNVGATPHVHALAGSSGFLGTDGPITATGAAASHAHTIAAAL